MNDSHVIKELRDMRYLDWSRIRKSSGTAGSFLKSYETNREGKKIYYKLSNYDVRYGITGHECVNEIIVCRLLDILGIEHLDYDLIHALIEIDGMEYETWLCASKDFKEVGDSKIALDDYYELEREADETPFGFCCRMGWERSIYEMILIDYLILNRDRHGANIEVLRNRRSQTTRLAQLFDHGMSLLCRCQSAEEAGSFDVMEDRPVQSFVGSNSAEDNLNLIPDDMMPRLRPLEKRDRGVILADLDEILKPVYLDKIWEMIWHRWERIQGEWTR